MRCFTFKIVTAAIVMPLTSRPIVDAKDSFRGRRRDNVCWSSIAGICAPRQPLPVRAAAGDDNI